MINIFVKLCIIIFINVNISVITPYYLCGKVEYITIYFGNKFSFNYNQKMNKNCLSVKIIRI